MCEGGRAKSHGRGRKCPLLAEGDYWGGRPCSSTQALALRHKARHIRGLDREGVAEIGESAAA